MMGSSVKVMRILQLQSITNKVLSSVRKEICFRPFAKDYHSSPFLYSGQDWRKERGLSKNPNSYGPLTDGPDYSFIDGRPTPPGSGKVKRALMQRDLAAKIIELSKEVDFAVDRHQNLLKKAEEEKAAILKRKLKPKGKEVS